MAEYENKRSVEGKVFVAECETYFSLYREWLETSLELAKADPFKIRSGIEAVSKQLEDKDPTRVCLSFSCSKESYHGEKLSDR